MILLTCSWSNNSLEQQNSVCFSIVQNIYTCYFSVVNYSFWLAQFTTSGMGTKIEYSINILGASQSSNSLAVHRVDDWDYFQKVGLKQKYQKTRFEDNLRYSVDRMLDKHNMDTIRKTMQMHEDTFRHQVWLNSNACTPLLVYITSFGK